MGSYLRGLPGGNYGPYRGLDLPDDDAFSYTSTENGDSMIYQSNTPYGKDVLASMNLSGQGHCYNQGSLCVRHTGGALSQNLMFLLFLNTEKYSQERFTN